MGLAKIAGKKLAEKAAEGALESVAKKAPRMSKAELEASGYYHPVGRGLKLSKPVHEYTADIIDNPDMPLVPKKIVSPEDLYGKVGIPLVGDRSDTGKLLRGIEGVQFDKPINLEGGFKFGRAHQYEDPSISSVWASDPGVVTALNNQIKRAAESGKDVLGVSSMGSPEMVDYNTMIAQSALNMTDLRGIHPKAIEAFNDEIKNTVKKNKEGKVTTPFQNFLGIDHPEITTQLLSKNAGELRKAFIRTMEKDQYRKLGFPELAPIRKAVSDAEILDMPLGSTGLEIYKMSPEGNIVETPKNPHSTYPVHMQGEVFGGLEAPIDYKNMFSTFYEPKRLLSVPDRHAYRAYSLSAPIQEFNQEWLDEVMPIYLQKIKDITGRKKGGEIHPDGSAKLANGASARKTLESILGKGYAGGGVPKKIGEKIGEKIAERIAKTVEKNIELPPASNSARTQIVGTLPTYEKARDILSKEGIQGSDIIDFGAGKGLGSTMMKAHSFEPYPQGWYPTFTKSADIPSDEYKGLLNLNVLNVLDPEMRAHTVEEIGRVIKPEGGVGLITTRGKDVMNTIGGRAGPEPMSIITSRDTYQKGFTPEELREYIKHILGSDYEYEPLGLGPAGVKIKKKADGGTITTPEIEVTPDEKLETLKEVPRVGKISGKIADVLKPASRFLEKYEIIPQVPLIGGTDLAELTGVKGVQTLAEDMSYGYNPIRNLERGKLQTSYFDPRLMDAVDLATTAAGGVGLAKNLGKTAIKEGMKQIETGTGMLGRNVINPRMNVIKDQGGMLVGGERALDDELISMKRNESAYPHAGAHYVTGDKDPNAVALNQWVDTKVRKYLRNQAGTEADPILKTIESGVEHRFQPSMGDTKYYVENQRQRVGKAKEGIAKTELGKEYEYKIDSMFAPKSSEEIKEILNSPMEYADPATAKRRKASLLRVEQDLPIRDEKDLDALMLINQIPDKNVYTLSGTNITERLGLNHVGDVLMEDLRSGKLRPEQLNQMSIEKAIRRTAEYDAEKAKAMTKAHATSIEGMPVPKQYDDGYKWVELKHSADKEKTKSALKSEGEMMGHCVGNYCPEVLSGEIKIYSLRSPDGKSHVTIEARPRYSQSQWYEANSDLINSDPYLKEIEPNIASGDIDAKYGNNPNTPAEYIRMMEKEMRKKGIEPVEPVGYMELYQVKGKQNKRPDEKYQKYVSDFIQNNPTKHEIVDVKELENTNLMHVDDVANSGIVPKEIHFHPDVEKAISSFYPAYKNLMASDKEELTYRLFKTAAKDLAKQKKNFFTGEDLLENIRNKYLPKQKAKGGSVNLEQEYKLENMRRRYG